MKKYYLFILLLLIITKVTVVNAQHNFQWAFNLGNINHDQVYDVVADNHGNIYTIGSFSGKVDFDPSNDSSYLTPFGFGGVFIAKYNSQKSLIWAKQIANRSYTVANSIAVDDSGKVYITGRFSGTLDFDPGQATNNMTAMGSYDAFVLKLDSNSSFIWAKQFGGSNGQGKGKDIQIDAVGNIYTTGRFEGPLDFDPGSGVFNLSGKAFTDYVFVSKLDMNGNFIWAKEFGGDFGIYLSSLILDNYGDLYIMGSFIDSVDFDPGVGITKLWAPLLSPRIYILKLNSQGGFLWVNELESSSGNDFGSAMTSDLQGNVYLTGSFSDTTDFDPGTGTHNLVASGNFGNADIFIAKYSTSGALIWANKIGNSFHEFVGSIQLDPYGNIYTIGSFEGYVDFDPGLAYNTKLAANSKDIFISKLSSAGNFIWAGSIKGPSDDNGYSITTDHLGNVYACGSFRDSADFDPGTGVHMLTKAGNSSGSLDGFIMKLFDVAVTLKEGSRLVNNIIIYPNPTINELFVESYFTGSKSFDIFSTEGVPVINGVLQTGRNTIDFSSQAAGVYFFRIEDQLYKVVKAQ